MGKNVEIAVEMLESLSCSELQEVFRYMNENMLIKLSTPGGAECGDIDRFVDTMEGIVGKDLRTRRRTHDIVWGRFIVAYQLLVDGWTTKVVGEVFGMDRSTMSYAKGQVTNMLSYPNIYPAEYALYREFKKRIRDGKMRMAG